MYIFTSRFLSLLFFFYYFIFLFHPVPLIGACADGKAKRPSVF